MWQNFIAELARTMDDILRSVARFLPRFLEMLAIVVAGLAVALAVLAGLAHDLAGTRVALALAGAGSVFAVDEAVLLDAAQRDLDDAVAVFADDRFFGDDVRDIFADRLADFLAMARAISGRAVGMLRVGAAVFAKDAFEGRHGCHPDRSEGSARSHFFCSSQNDISQSPPPS